MTIPALLLFILIAFNGCKAQPIDIVFLVDSTSSITNAQFETYRNAFLTLADSLGTGFASNLLQVAILQYGNNNILGLDYTDNSFYQNPTTLGNCTTVQCFRNAVTTNMPHLLAGNTFTATAIERAVKIDFANSANAATSTKFLILTTDGAATDAHLLATSYGFTSSANITVYAIGIGSEVVQSELQTIANNGVSNDRVTMLTDFSTLGETLVNISSSLIPEAPTTTQQTTTTTTSTTTPSTTITTMTQVGATTPTATETATATVTATTTTGAGTTLRPSSFLILLVCAVLLF